MHKILLGFILLANMYYSSDSMQESKETMVNKIGTISVLKEDYS